MPKMKSNRSAYKRLRQTASGKFVANKPFARHILTSKSRKRKRRLRGSAVISSANVQHVSVLLPYGRG